MPICTESIGVLNIQHDYSLKYSPSHMGRTLTQKQPRRRDQRISPAIRAATINRAYQIVAKVLENTPRKFGGVGWPGCGVVNIVLVGRRSAAAHRKKKNRGLGRTRARGA